MKNIYFLILSIILINCDTYSSTNSPEPHSTPQVSDTELCPAAEAHLTELCNADRVKNSYCCQVVAPTHLNKSFTSFCQDTQNSGIYLNPKCLSNITSCDQIDKCTLSK